MAPAPSPGRASYQEATFDLVLRPVGALSAGKPGAVEILLSAKGGYHCNEKYPYKFKVEESAGVVFASRIFTADTLTLEAERATMNVAFTPETPGEKTLRGTFSFSLCSAERCLVEKRALETPVAVSPALVPDPSAR